MSVKAAEVLMPPQPDLDAENEAPAAACATSTSTSTSTSASSDFFDPMEEFSRRLEDIISTYGSAASVMDRQSVVDAEMEQVKTETKEDIAVAMETEVSLVMQSLNKLSSPEDKLEDLVRRHAELAALRRGDDRKLCVLQQRLSVLLDERQQLQADSRGSIAARSELEALCKELQGHYDVLRAETLRRCREDEEKRKEMTGHFQMMLTEIQAQIEQHSVRNDKLCHENTNLTEKLESLMGQCELREENLEKINKRRDLQQKLTEAKLQQANALLTEAEEKHKREKEYLLVQAAEWKLQAQTYREQGTVMQAQLTLYAQKFDEFQETLSKSNEIYVRFKKEMDNMSSKMKKMEKESNLWKTRFENCNKALTDMIEERNEKGKEYELFVLKIQKLEKLCRALQEERAVLYDKIKEVRLANSNVQSVVLAKPDDVPKAEDNEDKSALLTPVELQEIEKQDPVLTKDMNRLRDEQAKLQEFAASLFATPSCNDDDDEGGNDELDPEEDAMASVFSQFQTKAKVKEEVLPVPEQVVEVKSEPVLPQPGKAEEVQKPAVSPAEPATPAEETSELTPADAKPEASKVQTQEKHKEVQPARSDEPIQQQSEPKSEPEKVPDLKPEAAEAEPPVQAAEVRAEIQVEEQKVQAAEVRAEIQVEEQKVQAAEVRAEIQVEEQKVQAEAVEAKEEAPEKKQTPKKKKKRNVKNVS